MNSTAIENIPQVWNDQDEQFFRITAALFTPAFCYGAGVLVASYDDDCDTDIAAVDTTTTTASVVAPVAVASHATTR